MTFGSKSVSLVNLCCLYGEEKYEHTTNALVEYTYV